MLRGVVFNKIFLSSKILTGLFLMLIFCFVSEMTSNALLADGGVFKIETYVNGRVLGPNSRWGNYLVREKNETGSIYNRWILRKMPCGYYRITNFRNRVLVNLLQGGWTETNEERYLTAWHDGERPYMRQEPNFEQNLVTQRWEVRQVYSGGDPISNLFFLRQKESQKYIVRDNMQDGSPLVMLSSDEINNWNNAAFYIRSYNNPSSFDKLSYKISSNDSLEFNYLVEDTISSAGRNVIGDAMTVFNNTDILPRNFTLSTIAAAQNDIDGLERDGDTGIYTIRDMSQDDYAAILKDHVNSEDIEGLILPVHAGPEDLEGYEYEFIGLHIPDPKGFSFFKKLERSIILINVDRTITLGAPHGWDLYSLMVHELGHAAGLDDTGHSNPYHLDFPDASEDEETEGLHVWNTMYRYMNRGSFFRRTLGTGDLAGLSEIYN